MASIVVARDLEESALRDHTASTENDSGYLSNVGACESLAKMPAPSRATRSGGLLEVASTESVLDMLMGRKVLAVVAVVVVDRKALRVLIPLGWILEKAVAEEHWDSTTTMKNATPGRTRRRG